MELRKHYKDILFTNSIRSRKREQNICKAPIILACCLKFLLTQEPRWHISFNVKGFNGCKGWSRTTRVGLMRPNGIPILLATSAVFPSCQSLLGMTHNFLPAKSFQNTIPNYFFLSVWYCIPIPNLLSSRPRSSV